MRVHLNPEEIEKYAIDLKIFARQSASNLKRIINKFETIPDRWFDNEFEHRKNEFRYDIRHLQKEIDNINAYHLFLIRKAKSAREYLEHFLASKSVSNQNTSNEIFEISSSNASKNTNNEDALKDETFTDKNGNNWLMRISNSKFLRLHNTRDPIPDGFKGSDCFANFALEKDSAGNSRLRLRDILTPPSLQNAGIGSHMLKKVESIARHFKVTEIYGSAPSQSNSKVRSWYKKRGYSFRVVSASGGEEVYKKI